MRLLKSSLKQRILLLVVCGMAALGICLGGIFLYTVNRESVIRSTEKMNYACREEGDRLNLSFARTEDVVTYISHTIQDYVQDPEQLRDPAFRQRLASQIQFDFENAVTGMKSVAAYYMVYNHAIAGADGFWYRMDPVTGVPQKQALTDVAGYGAAGDKERNGWDYIPVSRQTGAWLLPYKNPNIGIYVISYIQPVYQNGVLLAVVGLDIDFSEVKSSVFAKRAYSGGYPFFCAPDGRIYGHFCIADGTPGEKVGFALTEKIYRSGNGDRYYSSADGSNGREEFRQTFKGLKNGMTLIFSAPVSEVFSNRDRLIREGVLLIVLLCLAATLLAVFIVQKNFHKPLSMITEAVERVAHGNYDITLDAAGNHELHRLVAALNKSIDYIRHREVKMKEIAYIDALTGVQNFTAYVEKMRDIRGKISAGVAEFSIVMVDINGLKYVNDHFGHDKGNITICAVSELLCQVYQKERVYRIGGDEFVVLLEGEYYRKRRELLQKIKIYERDRDYQAENAWEQIAFSCGTTCYHPETDTGYDMVFERVDSKMYRKKEALKG